jgi:hypothetical protein
MIDKAYLKYLTLEYRKFQLKATALANNALIEGIISKPSTCSRCLTRLGLEMHHADYTKPLDITWLCKSCHEKEHITIPVYSIELRLLESSVQFLTYEEWLNPKQKIIPTVSVRTAKRLKLKVPS